MLVTIFAKVSRASHGLTNVEMEPVGLCDMAALTSGPCSPYVIIAASLDLLGLCRLDTACPLLLKMNKTWPWHAAGEHAYMGLEMADCVWHLTGGKWSPCSMPFAPAGHLPGDLLFCDWKKRCANFHVEMCKFFSPAQGKKITVVQISNMNVFCRCILRPDLLTQQAGSVCMEFEVGTNPNGLRLSLVDDMDIHEHGSVTFDPGEGAVRIHQLLHKNTVACSQFMPAAPAGIKFTGTMGIYLLFGGGCESQFAFYRRWSTDGMNALRVAAATTAAAVIAADTIDVNTDAAACVTSVGGDTEGNCEPTWETTGFCTELFWANSPQLAVCVSFRDRGQYNVWTTQVGRTPPTSPEIKRVTKWLYTESALSQWHMP